MTSLKNRHRLIILFIVLGIFLAAVIVNGIIRETIAPAVLAWVWRVTLMSRGFPQVIVWAIFIAIIPIIAVFSLVQSAGSEEPDSVPEQKPYHGRVRTWTRHIERTKDGRYFRERANRKLGNLLLDTLAYEQRLSRSEIRERLQTGQFQLDDHIVQFIQASLGTGRRLPGRYGRQTDNEISQIKPYDREIEQIISFLEAELEVTRGK